MKGSVNEQLKALYEEHNAWHAIDGVENLSSIQSSAALPKNIGLHRFLINGGVVYIGRATEGGKGLSKRLFDYTRRSDSARRFNGGWLANLHRQEISVEVMELDDIRAVKILEVLFIEYDKPMWNSRTGVANWLKSYPADDKYLRKCKEDTKVRK